MTRGARRIGFAVSAIVHVTGAALLVLPGTTPVGSAAPRAIAIDLEMFSTVAQPAVGRRDAAAAAAHAVPPLVRPLSRATVPERAAQAAADPSPPIATVSPRPRPAAPAKPGTAPAVMPPQPHRRAENAQPLRNAVKRAPPAAVPIDRTAQEPVPPQRRRPLPRAVERVSRRPGAVGPPMTDNAGRTALPQPAPAPAAAEIGSTLPLPPAAGTGSPQQAPVADSDAIRHAYLTALAQAIDRNKYYPRKSRRRAEQGTVAVAFVIAADGTISDVAVARSSGHRRLDAAARDAVRRLVRFRPIPEALARDRWSIRVPLDFRLR